MEATDKSFNAAESTWSVTFPNYTVSGIASCNSLTGSWGIAYPEYNDQITAGYQTNQLQCWCRMTSPVRSAWLYDRQYDSASECASDCAKYCGYYTQHMSNFRTAMYGSAGQ